MNMPAELKQALAAANGGPVEIVDGDQCYLVIRADIFRRLADVLDDDDVLAMYGRIGGVFGPDGWDDPAMDVYKDLDPRNPG